VKADINKRIAAEVSWSRTADRRARTQPARDRFLERFEREVDPDGALPPDQRRQRAEHAKKAYMLRLAKRSAVARKQAAGVTPPILPRRETGAGRSRGERRS
jgi:hypothetical protein